MDIEQRRDAHQEPPPRPVSHQHEFPHVPLDASHRQVLQFALLQFSARQVTSAMGLERDDHACQALVALRFQLGDDAGTEEYLE